MPHLDQTDILDYAIRKVLSQLILGIYPNKLVIKGNLDQWHLVAFFLKKMIPVKTWYKTHDGKLLAIIKFFKTWWYYLEGCKQKVLIFTNQNKLCRFIDTKNLDFRLVQ